MKWNQSWSTNQQRLVFASVWELQVTHFSVRFTFSTFSPLFYSSFTLFFFSHSLTLFDVVSLLSFLTHWGFSISLVHDGELTRTSLSEAWSQTVTQVGVWLFISHLLIAAHPHTHTHAHADTLSQGRPSRGSPCNLAANQNMILCPWRTWVACNLQLYQKSVFSLFQCTSSIKQTAGLQLIVAYTVDSFSNSPIHRLVYKNIRKHPNIFFLFFL